jgi:hypothetical protein
VRFIVCNLLLIALTGCSMSADTNVAERAIPNFHYMLDAGQFDAIYDASSDHLRQASRRKDFDNFLKAVHGKLGNTKASSQRSFFVNYGTNGTFVTITHNTQFDCGDGIEQFVYVLSDGKASLVGYQINSNALIVSTSTTCAASEGIRT